MKSTFFFIVIAASFFLNPAIIFAGHEERKIAPSEELIAEGRHQFGMRCARCHGRKGDGKGPLADILDPRPRDFTMGTYKFRTTRSGALPTDEDIFRTITRGVSGTAMPSWGGLPPELRWALVYYIKTLAPEFGNKELNPYNYTVALPPEVPLSPESIARGRILYEKNKCWECHGMEGRGDGRTNLKDDWGYPTRVANLRRGWNIKGGNSPRDMVYRFITGINGTAMPSFEFSISGEDRWHLANYIYSIAQGRFDDEKIFRAGLIKGEIPPDPSAKLWNGVKSSKIIVGNQDIAEPYWINNSVDMIDVRALYNKNRIAFLLEWDDPVRDASHDGSREVTNFKDRYVMATGEIPREAGIFRDALAMQFPLASTLDDSPPPIGGSTAMPVNVWHWKSDLGGKGAGGVEDSNSWSFDKFMLPQQEAGQNVISRAEWKDGRWRVLLTRSLKSSEVHDVKFEKGAIIPVSFYVWDGSNGEHGRIMGLSPWYLLYLDDPASDKFDSIRKTLRFFGVSREFSN